MGIVYYPNRVYKKTPPAIDCVRSKPDVVAESGGKDTTSEALDVTISSEKDWKVNSIMLTFSNTTARDYEVSIANGRKVVDDLNDYLWFQHTNTLWQKITLDTGFYTGTELAAELKLQLDANTAFTDLGITFTVAYDSLTGQFTVTPSSGELKYIDKNNTQQLSDRDSIAGHLFGLNEDSVFASNVVSDTNVFGLNESSWIIDQTASVVPSHYNDDIRILDLDQAIKIVSNVAATVVNYTVRYEALT